VRDQAGVLARPWLDSGGSASCSQVKRRGSQSPTTELRGDADKCHVVAVALFRITPYRYFNPSSLITDPESADPWYLSSPVSDMCR
jgi:hypothetical protein